LYESISALDGAVVVGVLGTTGVVGVGSMPGVAVVPDTSARYFALESGPKIPDAGEMPFAACHFAIAALVLSRRSEVSLPGDPTPVSATLNPAPLRYFWRHRTSSPSTPKSRVLAKLHDAASTGVELNAMARSAAMATLLKIFVLDMFMINKINK
jgi:hypothetical protein